MKEHWNNLVEQIQKTIDDDAAVINGLRSGPDVAKIKKNFERNVKTLSKLIEEFSVFVPDPESEKIEMPFESEEFAENWEDYKAFLYEVYQVILLPREERRRLNYLNKISGRKEEEALELIDFYIRNRCKTILIPKNFQLNNDQPGDEPEVENPFTLKQKII
ncbi:hypothetical protein SDC9_136061 [bioreactor metagenome]|uniref:Uncharacterized protein n=1 Tax=bioreactor metagenome TaxID=1076179 RepID=A0A645DI66_9ZZZZ|nr:hypothetical protein [Proteiniphilum sp.]MEA4918117.1 hypothetical protein [Proteiniphilum sp.]